MLKIGLDELEMIRFALDCAIADIESVPTDEGVNKYHELRAHIANAIDDEKILGDGTFQRHVTNDHIERLAEATNSIEIFIAQHRDGNTGLYSLAIRDKENRGVCIDHQWWLIAGTVYTTDNIEVQRLEQITDLSGVYVSLHASASLGGKYVTVDLGRKKIVSIVQKDRKNIFEPEMVYAECVPLD